MSSLGHLSVSNDHLPGDHLEEVHCALSRQHQLLFSQAMSASTIVQLFLILGLFFSSIGGLVVASILKKLDNVVKVTNYLISLRRRKTRTHEPGHGPGPTHPHCLYFSSLRFHKYLLSLTIKGCVRVSVCHVLSIDNLSTSAVQ